MKKILSLVLALMMLATLVLCSCGKTADDKKTDDGKKSDVYEIAVVTDVGQLMDKGFNQGTYEGAKAYAEAHNIAYKYYQPANGSDASDNDRIAAMKQAINNGAKIIGAPGFLQAKAMRTVAMENPNVKFVFIDGWNLTDKVDDNGGDIGSALLNVTAVTYKEEESGFLAGYAAVMEGYTKLGYTGGGGGSNPACNRFGYGFVQGAEAAAKEKNVDVTINYSYKFGEAFSASPELQTQIAGWYAQGVEAVFALGGIRGVGHIHGFVERCEPGAAGGVCGAEHHVVGYIRIGHHPLYGLETAE